MYRIDLRDLPSLRSRLGQELAVSEWMEIDQDRIDQFASAIDDQQWIHVDAERARTESPYGITIAHGFLTLSLLSVLARQAMEFDGLRMAVNYGLNRVRFVAPVPSGSHVRARFTLQSIEEAADAVLVTWSVLVERQTGGKPAAVAEWLTRYYTGS